MRTRRNGVSPGLPHNPTFLAIHLRGARQGVFAARYLGGTPYGCSNSVATDVVRSRASAGVAREHTPLGLGEHTGTYRVIRVLPSRSGSSRPYHTSITCLTCQHLAGHVRSRVCSSVWNPRPMAADEFKPVLTAAFVQDEAARS